MLPPTTTTATMKSRRYSSEMEEHGGDGSSEFYKIVFEPVSQGVRLPTLFMRNHGHSLTANTAVTLYVPAGDSWPVRLRQTDTGLWLGRGWQEFAAHYEIEARHFLYFKYEGSARFRVVIFHPRGSETDYPHKADGNGNGDGDGDEGDKEMLDLDENPRRRRRRQAGIRAREKEEFESYRTAARFESENPFFLVFMQPSYVTNSYLLSINFRHVQDSLPENKENGSSILQAHVPGNNKVWDLTYTVYRNGRKTVVTKGWKEFAVGNHLRFGDVCVFELVNPPALRFNVSIFRNT